MRLKFEKCPTGRKIYWTAEEATYAAKGIYYGYAEECSRTYREADYEDTLHYHRRVYKHPIIPFEDT